MVKIKPTLNESDFIDAAKQLNVSVAVIKAVCEVEAPRGGFLRYGQPVILFERHKFHQFTEGIYSKTNSDISNPRPGGYLGYSQEHLRLQKATKLNREAGLKSASWGRFQIMGFNYKLCGFTSLQKFINAMYRSEKSQLDAFVNFIKSVKLQDELQKLDWHGFARAYNGKNYYKNKYAKRLKKAYKKYEKQAVKA
ncbi:N-acetylmuramidase family protein [Tenacibaculum maritimum]|uniref:N-acetylmuramidase family protein n=1 Tax=Tenacibaculum maritimum TaxID=107401 RepID=UPI0012E49EB7|nr:N-acetylmuramidase family protein [Tenacibaculum maritimum]CAA0152172.1 Peptidoglycan-binding protein [Tenacibaculum maritimum]